MKSKLPFTYYLVVTLITVFLWSMFVGMNLDGTLPLFSKGWYLMLLPIIFTNILFIISFLKIPKIQIIGNRIRFKSLDVKGEFKQEDITKIESVATSINSWYSFRGGIKIYVEDKIYSFPFHCYTNETELLQKIYKVVPEKIQISNSYQLSNLKYIRYFYRNFGTFFLFLSIPFLILLFSINKNAPFTSKLILAIIPTMLILVFKVSSFYVTVSANGCAKKISTGRGSRKNITIALKNKKIITWRAELNKQSELEKIAKEFHRHIR